jgi:hypothetical protein
VTAIHTWDAQRSLIAWHWGGLLSLLVVGTLLHFTFQWSGRSPLVGVFSAVNESVWEHLKLGFWSLLWFSLVEFWVLRSVAHNYWAAKAAGLLVMHGFILLVFYSQQAVLGRSLLAVDIGSYFGGAFLCQLASYRIMVGRPWALPMRLVLVLLLVAHGAALVVFTFVPPRLELFRDGRDGTYGLQRERGLSDDA